MLWTALRRLRDEEDGFTLIELMVVVMILAILIVMGLPTFLGVKARFQDRAAQTTSELVDGGCYRNAIHPTLLVGSSIIAILIVMGLPTFLDVKARFQDRAAQTDLRRSSQLGSCTRTTATFTNANVGGTGLVTIVPNMCYVASATLSAANGTVACASGAGGGSISVASTATQFAAARMSSSTSCFVILDATTGTKYGETTAANCSATWAATAGNVTATTPAAAGW